MNNISRCPTSEAPTRRRIFVGETAPGFEIECTATEAHPEKTSRLADYRGRWLVLLFYPQDFSLVCPTELSALSDRHSEFDAHNADVLAISTDSIDSHRLWVSAPRSRGGLGPISFPLGSDPTGEVAEAYGVYARPLQMALRGLFIVDPNSVLQYQVVHNLSTGRNTDEVLRVLTALQVGGLCGEGWSADSSAIEPAEELQPGSVISSYEIREVLGEGGFATVFRARDRVLKRTVALKILKRSDGGTPEIRREARAAAALNHNNICTIYTVDQDLGFPMIVMEYIDGRVLSELIDSGAQPATEVRRIGRQIASGMAEAHAAGIVHGDLKPGNVMVKDNGQVKVLDFGLADLRCCSTTDTTASSCGLGRVGLAGTPGYLSPEQANGSPASPTSDVFALGLILWELLAGKHLLSDCSVLEALNRLQSLESTSLAAGLNEPFATLIPKMLQRDPRARTIDMHQIQQMLS